MALGRAKHGGILRLLRALALLVLCAYANIAQSATLFGVINESSPDDRAPAEHLLQQIAAQNDQWHVDTPSSLPATDEQNTVYLAFGPQALESLIRKQLKGPILALYCDSSTYNQLLSQAKNPKRITAVYGNPDPARQLALIKVLLGPGARVTVWSAPTDVVFSREQLKIASVLDLSTTIVSLKSGSTLRNSLSTLENSNVLYLDKRIAVENKIPIDQLLIQAYDLYQIGIVGYSPAVVKAGALATTYSTDDDIAKTASVLFATIKTGVIPPARFPADFHVIVNQYVARSINLLPPDDADIKNQIDIFSRKYRGEGGQSN